MKSALRELYQPLQPVYLSRHAHPEYNEMVPAHVLQEFIYCYWDLKSTYRLDRSFNYTVVSDGCIDIFWNKKNPSESYVMGTTDVATQFSLGVDFHYAVIRFLPSAFPVLYKVDADELRDSVIELETIDQTLSKYLQQQLSSQSCLHQDGLIIDAFYLEKLNRQPATIDPRIIDLLTEIVKRDGSMRLRSDLTFPCSQRQVRRLFNQFIGKSPKTFIQILRFQKLLQDSPSVRLMLEKKLYFDAGYYDQAHFIKEFKRFHGTTPGQLL